MKLTLQKACGYYVFGKVTGRRAQNLNCYSEAFLEPSWTPTVELFCENSWQVLGVFWQKSSIVDVQLGSKYASVLSTSLGLPE